jgi:hypothetical protein
MLWASMPSGNRKFSRARKPGCPRRNIKSAVADLFADAMGRAQDQRQSAVARRSYSHRALVLDVSIVTLAGQAAGLAKPGLLLAHFAKIVAALAGGWVAQSEKEK